MAHLDVHQDRDFAGGLLLDCQSDTLSYLNTRLIVPLRRPADAPLPAHRLNPAFLIDETTYIMVTQFVAAMPARNLGRRIGDLADQRDAIIGALDVLITGI
jgi:toxin CcdB